MASTRTNPRVGKGIWVLDSLVLRGLSGWPTSRTHLTVGHRGPGIAGSLSSAGKELGKTSWSSLPCRVRTWRTVTELWLCLKGHRAPPDLSFPSDTSGAAVSHFGCFVQPSLCFIYHAASPDLAEYACSNSSCPYVLLATCASFIVLLACFSADLK